MSERYLSVREENAFQIKLQKSNFKWENWNHSLALDFEIIAHCKKSQILSFCENKI